MRSSSLITFCIMITVFSVFTGCSSGGGGGGGGASIPDDVYLVDKTGDNSDGKSWATAFNTIQKAVDAALADGGGSVWVAAGVYTNGGSTDSVVTMESSVNIYGGFEGYDNGTGAAEKSIDLRNSTLNVTVIEGMGVSLNVVTAADNSLIDGFFVSGGLGSDGAGLLVDGVTGLTVESCVFSDNGASSNGGAVLVSNSADDVVLNRCTFTGNAAAGLGGAMSLSASKVSVIDCTFLSNTATTGGGALYVANTPDVTVTGCTFVGNSTPGAGGAVANNLGGDVIYRDCLFGGNDAGIGGGAVSDVSSPQFYNCVFSANEGPGSGGGMAITTCTLVVVEGCSFYDNTVINGHGGGIYSFNTEGKIIDCTFSGNSVIGAHTGGGIHMAGTASSYVRGCTFTNNYAEHRGGAYSFTATNASEVFACIFEDNRSLTGGGAVDIAGGGNVQVSDSLFYGNRAGLGGAVYNETDSWFLNCTFVVNRGTSGGAFTNSGGDATIANCIFQGNYASTSPQIYNDGAPVANIWYSAIEGSYPGSVWDTTLGTDWEGNIDADALFVNAPTRVVYTNSAGTSTSINVANAPTFCSIGDVIEINHDGIPRTVQNLELTVIHFAPALEVTLPVGALVYYWGVGAADLTEDLTLSAGSPCIDAGHTIMAQDDKYDFDSDTDTAEPVPYDLAGNTRVVDDPGTADTGGGTAPMVDMGAYEF